MDYEHLSSIVVRIYQAAAAPDELWQSVLQQVIGATSARTGWLHTWRRASSLSLQTLGSVGIDAEALDAYRDHYCAIDPWCAAVLRLPPGQLMLSHQHVSPEAYDKTEIFNDYVRPFLGDTAFIASVALPIGSGNFASIGLHRLRTNGPFCGRDADALEFLLPHLRHALSIRGHIDTLEAERSDALATLNRLPLAALVVDASARIGFLNQAAERILARNDGLTLSRIGLRAATTASHAALSSAIARAAQHGIGTTLSIGRRSDAPAYMLSISPLAATGSRSNRVLVIIGQPGETPSERTLIAALTLTPAEAAVARALALGDRVEDVAARRGVSIPTVRAQVSALLAKTGTQRQADLIRMIMTIPTMHHSS